VLYLSEYFLNNRKSYYDALEEYHSGNVRIWLDFFLDGVAIIAQEAIETSRKITTLRVRDMEKIQSFGRRAKTGMSVLKNLYRLPIVNVRKIEEWTGLSRPQANELVKKFVEIGILVQIDKNVEYGREFWYKDYLEVSATGFEPVTNGLKGQNRRCASYDQEPAILPLSIGRRIKKVSWMLILKVLSTKLCPVDFSTTAEND
jgi:hypothetical protein